MDEADIRYYINHANVHFQSQGFAALLSAVSSEKNEKRQKEFAALLFDCLSSKSCRLVEWTCAALQSLLCDPVQSSSAILPAKSEAVDEVLARIEAAHHQNPVVELLFKISLAGVSDECDKAAETVKLVLRVHSKIKNASNVFLPQLKQLPIQTLLPVAVRLLYAPTNSIDACMRQSLVAHCIKLCSEEEPLEKLADIAADSPLLNEEIVDCLPQTSQVRTKLVVKKRLRSACALDLQSTDLRGDEFLPDILYLLAADGSGAWRQILSNPSLTPHPSLLFPLLSLYGTTGELLRCPVAVAHPDDVALLKEWLTKVQKLDVTSFQQPLPEKVNTLADYFRWTISKEARVPIILDAWKEHVAGVDDVDNVPTQLLWPSVAFLSGLCRFIPDDSFAAYLEILTSYSTHSQLQNQLGLLFMTFFSQAVNEERKRFVLQALPKIAKNAVVTRQLLKLLFALRQSALKEVIFEVVGELWKINSWILDENELQHLTIIDYRNDSEELVLLKFSLLRRICETEYGERFLSNIVDIVDAGEDWSLPNAIRCLSNLCKQNAGERPLGILLEVSQTKSRVDKAVRNTQSSEVLTAYCELLATSTVDKDDFGVALKCAQELWRLKDHKDNDVKTSAWTALSQFSPTHLTQRMLQPDAELSEEDQERPISGEQLFHASANITTCEVLQGFGTFLHRMIACELEDLSRAFYHHETRPSEGNKSTDAESAANDPVLSVLIPTLRSTLEGAGHELEALSLMEPLTKSLQPLTKKASRCSQIYQSALLKAVPSGDLSFRPTLVYFSAWRTGTEAVVNAVLMSRRKQNPNYSITVVRDQVVDMMRGALDQLTEATANVIVSLPFLCRLVSENLKDESAETTNTTHAHWQVSVLEYLLLHAIDDYQPRTLPLFQKEITRTPTTRRLALLAAALILNRFNISYVQDMPELVSIAAEYLASTNDVSADAEWICPVIRVLLRPGTACDEAGASGLTNIAYALLTGDDANVIDEHFDCINGRVTLNLLSSLLGADATTVENVADEMRADLSVEERFLSMKVSDSTCGKVEELFDLFGRLEEKQQQKLAYQFAKNVEKATKIADIATVEASRGLALYHASHRMGTGSCKLPIDYEYLPDTSVLRATVGQIMTSKDHNRLHALLKAMVPQQRKDGRNLPPLDLTVLSNLSHLQEDQECLRTLFHLAVQQKHVKVVTKLLGRGLLDECLLDSPMDSLIPRIAEIVPKQALRNLVQRVMVELEKSRWPDEASHIAKAIALVVKSNSELLDVIYAHMPSVESFSSLLHPYFRYFGSIDQFDGVEPAEAPSLYKLWVQLRKGGVSDINGIIDLLSAMRSANSQSLSNAALLTMVKFLQPVNLDARLEMLSSLAAQIRIRKSSASAPQISGSIFDLFFALVISTASAHAAPLCLDGEDEVGAVRMLQQRFPEVVDNFICFVAAGSESILKTLAICAIELCSFPNTDESIRQTLLGNPFSLATSLQ